MPTNKDLGFRSISLVDHVSNEFELKQHSEYIQKQQTSGQPHITPKFNSVVAIEEPAQAYPHNVYNQSEDGGGGSPRSAANPKVAEYSNVIDIPSAHQQKKQLQLQKQNQVLNLDSRGSDAASNTGQTFNSEHGRPISRQKSQKHASSNVHSNSKRKETSPGSETQKLKKVTPGRKVLNDMIRKKKSSLSPKGSKLQIENKIAARASLPSKYSIQGQDTTKKSEEEKIRKSYQQLHGEQSLMQLKKSIEKHIDPQDLALDARQSLTMEEYQHLADNATMKAAARISPPRKPKSPPRKLKKKKTRSDSALK